MGMGMFVQTVIESAFNSVLLILIFAMWISIIQDKKHSFFRKLTIPYTKTIMIFYISIFGYNVAQITLSVYEEIPTKTAGIIMNVSCWVYYLFGEILTLFFLEVVKANIIEKYCSGLLKYFVQILRLVQAFMCILLVATPFTDILYYFDEHNEYHRSVGYNLWSANSIVTFVFIGMVCAFCWKKIDLFLRKVIAICVFFP